MYYPFQVSNIFSLVSLIMFNFKVGFRTKVASARGEDIVVTGL
jgi:hypothetical protein